MRKLLRAAALLIGLAAPAAATNAYFATPTPSTATGTAYAYIAGQYDFAASSQNISTTTVNVLTNSTWTITLNGVTGAISAAFVYLRNSLTALTASFTGTGNSTYSITMSSGGVVNAGGWTAPWFSGTFYGALHGNADTATTATTAGGAPPTGSASGDLGGSFPAPTVNQASNGGGFTFLTPWTAVSSGTIIANVKHSSATLLIDGSGSHFQLRDGTQGNGSVLTSDGNGVGTWQSLSSGGANLSSTQTFSGSNTFAGTGFSSTTVQDQFNFGPGSTVTFQFTLQPSTCASNIPTFTGAGQTNTSYNGSLASTITYTTDGNESMDITFSGHLANVNSGDNACVVIIQDGAFLSPFTATQGACDGAATSAAYERWTFNTGLLSKGAHSWSFGVFAYSTGNWELFPGSTPTIGPSFCATVHR